MKVGVIIPALDEEACIGGVVCDFLHAASPDDHMRVVVCDNGSTDDTSTIAKQAGAEVVYESYRGYGAACLRAIEHFADWPDVIVFVDGDGSSDCRELQDLLAPLRRDQADLVIGWRRFPDRGSMTLPQRLGNSWFCLLVRLRWGVQGHDMGPFRAVTRRALNKLQMSDRTWGWTLQMQIKAHLLGLRTVEVPVRWRHRLAGRSKISGTLIGVIRACGRITATFAQYALFYRCHARNPRDVVVAFFKYPLPGRVKTRLGRGVGEAGATQIYHRLAVRCYRQLDSLQQSGLADVAVFGAGRTTTSFREWLPGARYYWPQPDGELSCRLRRAFALAFAGGAPRVAAIGTDSPGLDDEMISCAFGELRRADVVVVPNTDGGYALIAMKQPHALLFEDIDWSTPSVLTQTRQRAERFGLRLSELPAVPDIDTAEDLHHLPPLVSIVMPVLNEETVLRRNLPELMRRLARLAHRTELIVVDGGSSDASLGVARDSGAVVISSPKGRGRQMNVGTAAAKGEWLWYLHADCLPAEGALEQMLAMLLKHHRRAWGYYRARIDAPGAALRVIEWGINLRSRLLSFPYGDQGLFVRRDLVQQIGGFTESPLLEDVDLVRRLARAGRPIRVRLPLLIDPRRWRRHGAWRTTAINWRILFDYCVLKKDIHMIARRYATEEQADSRLNVELQEGAVR
ncbi:MAG: TIGR04283 family arsenosugar biosynthesis glycosyltransferase [Planctomycetes bacterium]|nr:TIGR04283 family arsenosugar biosynthesis glycosyltransferase [Planctomycetota bacterium]